LRRDDPERGAFTFDPREAERHVAGLLPRRELIYRLAIRTVCSQ
jgi:hypothetical protein